MWRKLQFTGFSILLVLSLVLAACGNSGNNGGNESSNGAGGNSDKGNTETKSGDNVKLGNEKITLAYVAWQSAIASNNVMKQVLESVGYDVTLKQTTTGPMYAAVASGSADGMIVAWLPTTDKEYMDKYEDKLVDLGISLKKAPQGLVVPKYVKIDSVEDLAKNKNNIGKKTNWTITGIDAGAGEMQIIRKKMMPAYGLDKWKLQPSSSTGMLAALGDAIDNHEPIVAVLWQPHWAFIEWDLKFLKDPKDVFKKPDDVHTLVRKGFKEDYPAATKIFKQFHWEKQDMQKVMAMIHKGMDPKEAAEKWISNHKDLVSEWKQGVK